MRSWKTFLALSLFLAVFFGAISSYAASDTCERPTAKSIVRDAENLQSHNGVLETTLVLHNSVGSKGQVEYCYVSPEGHESPTLRVKPGGLLLLHLKNELSIASKDVANEHLTMHMSLSGDPCSRGTMDATATNLHFHGMSIPPTCHQDEVLKTTIEPGDAPFEYRIRIPEDQPPGLYWYHPHIHGFSKTQVLGGASGALIVEGLERANKKVAGLRERVFVIRDEDLHNPDAQPLDSPSVVPPVRIDRDGDVMNTGTGTGKPAKDLSINYVPVAYPDYPPAVIRMKPGQREIWRVVNACAITYLNLQVVINHSAKMLEIVGLDGVPVNRGGGVYENTPLLRNHLGVPPGGRIEFLMDAPASGVPAAFVTRTVNTGPGGENDPNRPLADIVTDDQAADGSIMPQTAEALPSPKLPWLGDVQPVRTRKFYFSEKLQNPDDPNSPTTFYITAEGETPTPFDPNSSIPNVTVKQGDVEDWIIENRSNELHAFHIHQIHFLMLEWFGISVNEPFLRDTINVPFYDGKTPQYPSVKLRMDFRDPKIVGTFLYHCHLLEHEDNGMMGLIRVEPADEHRSNNAIEEKIPAYRGKALFSICNKSCQAP